MPVATDWWPMLLGPLSLFVCILTRVASALMVLPATGDQVVPVRVRALLAIAITAVAFPVFSADGPAEASPWLWTVVLLREVALGMAAGLVLRVFLTAAGWAGQMIGQLSGLGLADVFDPALQAEVPAFARLLDLTTVTILLLAGGHRAIVAAVLDSLAAFPPAQLQWPGDWAQGIIRVLSASMELGVRVAAPVAAAALLATLVTGVVSRTLPQLNILAVGFPLNALVALAALWGAIGVMAGTIHLDLQELLENLGTLGPSG